MGCKTGDIGCHRPPGSAKHKEKEERERGDQLVIYRKYVN